MYNALLALRKLVKRYEYKHRWRNLNWNITYTFSKMKTPPVLTERPDNRCTIWWRCLSLSCNSSWPTSSITTPSRRPRSWRSSSRYSGPAPTTHCLWCAMWMWTCGSLSSCACWRSDFPRRRRGWSHWDSHWPRKNEPSGLGGRSV